MFLQSINMHKILFASFFAIVLFSFNACHDHDEDTDDKTAPGVTITSPTDNASLPASAAIAIKGTVTDEASLHELTITVTNDADSKELFKATPTVHDKTSYTISESFTPSGVTAAINATLTVTAEDHNSNITTKAVKFVIKP
jgi:Bacterial Ig domain